jgi:hypothetical protein
VATIPSHRAHSLYRRLGIGTSPCRHPYSHLRFSTQEQAKGDSLRRQTALAVKHARVKKLDLDKLLSFRDLGVSACRRGNSEPGQLSTFGIYRVVSLTMAAFDHYAIAPWFVLPYQRSP